MKSHSREGTPSSLAPEPRDIAKISTGRLTEQIDAPAQAFHRGRYSLSLALSRLVLFAGAPGWAPNLCPSRCSEARAGPGGARPSGDESGK